MEDLLIIKNILNLNNDLIDIHDKLICGVVYTTDSLTVNAKSLVTIEFYINPPSDKYFSIPFYSYTRMTGWSGIIQQGIHISMTDGKITLSVYNTTDVTRTVSLNVEALFYKK